LKGCEGKLGEKNDSIVSKREDKGTKKEGKKGPG